MNCDSFIGVKIFETTSAGGDNKFLYFTKDFI